MGSMTQWQRIEYDSTPIYIRPDAPDWFVPNRAADEALLRLIKNEEAPVAIEGFLKRIEGPVAAEYLSRSTQLKLDTLRECWLHITNRCNMECRHCMFESSPRASDELTPGDCDRIVHEFYELGCRLYFFTGGEPFLAKGFDRSVHDILRLPDTNVVILTNLSTLSRQKDRLRSLPRERLHFQVSLDGLQSAHDALRGPGAFNRLIDDLATLRSLGFPVTLSTTVTGRNVDEMELIVDFAARQQVFSLHFLWFFKKGHADGTLFVEPERIFPRLTAAQERAEKSGVKIDNVETLRSQVFSCPGTRYDLGNAGWQSIAVGPDGQVYPTPALVYTREMQCGHVSEGLKRVWENSPVLNTIRAASLNQSDACRANPLRYIIGGGDIDHSFISSGQIVGGDPYAELYGNLALWLIAREAQDGSAAGYPAMRLKMGEKLGECPVEGGGIFLTHSNCVLSLPGHDVHTRVDHFYTAAAEDVREDILNPICYEEDLVKHIPKETRYRSYGCGSPVMEAVIRQGENVVDLGSGTGIECFIASKQTGPRGRVVGIDMGDAMLAVAGKTRTSVAEQLHYDNIEFKKAFLEDLPLADGSADLIISNCVLNLSPDKRRVFREIFRILKPGGRLVVSDITHDEDLPLDIVYNDTLRGECIGGALRYQDLFGLLNDLGFSHSEILKGYHYRTVKGHDFYSVTYRAIKPPEGRPPVLFDFPDFRRTMAAAESEPTCSCFITPVQKPMEAIQQAEMHRTGCMVCGSELIYLETNRNDSCHYCGRVMAVNTRCVKGHFVCDDCHRADAIEIIKQVCLHSRESDAVALMQTIRSHRQFGVHGPEHHSLVPAVILTALKNSGEAVTEDQIVTAIQRGQTIGGGACAFLGACGAAIGVGIAISVLLAANPYDGGKRQLAQRATQRILGEIASYNAPRCCQRDSWLALRGASRILEEMGKTLPAVRSIMCEQYPENKECIHDECPLWPVRAGQPDP